MITLELPAPEFVQRFQAGEIPSSARVTVIYDNDASEAQSPALALVEQWLAQAPHEAHEIAEAEKDLRELQAALNDTRERAGERILYPAAEKL